MYKVSNGVYYSVIDNSYYVDELGSLTENHVSRIIAVINQSSTKIVTVESFYKDFVYKIGEKFRITNNVAVEALNRVFGISGSIYRDALNYYGSTLGYNGSGFILPSGSFVRVDDSDENLLVNDYVNFESNEKEKKSLFLRFGALYFDYNNECFNMCSLPTDFQFRTMIGVISTLKKGVTVNILRQGDLSVIVSEHYPFSIPASKIACCVKKYFGNRNDASLKLSDTKLRYEDYKCCQFGVKGLLVDCTDYTDETVEMDTLALEVFNDFRLVMESNKNFIGSSNIDIQVIPFGEEFCSLVIDGLTVESLVKVDKYTWENLRVGCVSKTRRGSIESIVEDIRKDIKKAKKDTDTNPSPKQKEAGNYKKGSINLDGMSISLENPKGSKRCGTDRDGQNWEVVMPYNYGYIRNSEGNDGDHVDIAFTDNPDAGDLVCVINQVRGKEFDEHKVFYGMTTESQALDLYCRGFSDGKGMDRMGSCVSIGKNVFREWLFFSNKKKEISVCFK